jgi:hypothetical protein
MDTASVAMSFSRTTAPWFATTTHPRYVMLFIESVDDNSPPLSGWTRIAGATSTTGIAAPQIQFFIGLSPRSREQGSARVEI